MKKRVLTLLVLCCVAFGAKAQDIQFSQYHASPMTLNPAMTGFFDGDYRLVANYRNQWSKILSGLYRTVSGSVDATFLKGKLETDYLGVGLVVVQDWAGSANYRTTQAGLSLAYSKGFGVRVKHALKVGFQGTYTQVGVDIDATTIFPDDVVESIGNLSGQFDFGAGFVYHTIPKRRLNIYFGGAYHHILQPSISFLGDGSLVQQSKISASTGALIEVGNNINLLPSILFVWQDPAWQLNLGSYVQFIVGDEFDSETAFALGAWTRIANPTVDAVILGARFDFKGLSAAVTYDVNLSELSAVTNGRGAFEASLIWIGALGPGRYKGLSCPRF